MLKRTISAIVITVFVFSLGPMPSAMALRPQGAEGTGAQAVGDAIKTAAAPLATGRNNGSLPSTAFGTGGTAPAAGAAAAGLSVTLPADIAAEVTAKVEALRATLQTIEIKKDGAIVYHGVKVRISISDLASPDGKIAYIGANVSKLAADKRVLLIANSEIEAKAKKVEIVALEGTGLKPDNIVIATSPEEVKAALAQPGGIDFVIRVGVISFEAQLRVLSLPKVSMEYSDDQIELRKRLTDATLASSV